MTVRSSRDRGAVAVLVALLMAPVLITCAALAVDVARWYAVGERVQRAVDAAALAAAPLWATSRAEARAAAVAAAGRNGVVPTASTRLEVSPAGPGIVRVTVSTRIPALFGGLVGVSGVTTERVAEASYAAPVSMGSSCNLFGDEPDPASGNGTDVADGSGSVASSLCLLGRRPHLWATIAGPDTSKVHGDRYASRWCDPGDTACLGRTNLDYTGGASGSAASPVAPPSYFLRITVRRPVPSISVQLFDPAFVDVGAWCERMPRKSATDPSWPGVAHPNPYVTDAATRYAYGNQATDPASSGGYCTGDDLVVAPGTAGATPAVITTSVALHAPTDSGDPWRAPVIAGCVRQYPGWALTPTGLVSALTAPTGRSLQRLFRQWVTVCTVRAPQVGDYYLQVRTNLTSGNATAARMADPREDPGARGTGQNRFAVRVDAPVDQAAVTVAAVERMAVYANLAGSASTFLLARVGSVSAGATLRVELFDIGDAGGSTSLVIAPPAEATGTWPAACAALGDVRGSPLAPVALPGCRLAGIVGTAGFNGRAQRIDVPIPADYRCNDADPAGCWYRVQVEYGAALYDATTWSAWVEGDPLRLVR